MPARLVLIPGMGADHRLFDGIELPGREVLRTDWIPHRDGEHLSAYAGRFAEHYGVGAADILMPAQRKLVLEMFEVQNMAFIRWACGAVMEWTGAPRLPGTVTIHGTADRVFPIRRQPRVDVTIQGGGHLMVIDRATEITVALRHLLL